MTLRARILLTLTSTLWANQALAYDSKCYHPDGSDCAPGRDAARNRWRGPGDEHRRLWDDSAASVSLPAYLSDEGSFTSFPVAASVAEPAATLPPSTKPGSTGGMSTLMPVPFAAADVGLARNYSIGEMAQLPDFSFSVWDWASGNETCPINGPQGAPLASADECHDFKSHMGALNSNHFVPQAGWFFHHYHDIALERARACMEMRLSLPEQFASFIEACDREAFTFEAVAHHFLQDSWSMGHMWERWGGPDLTDFPGGVDARAPAVLIAMTSGLIHGARGVLEGTPPGVDWNDPLCAPLNPFSIPDWPGPYYDPPSYQTESGSTREGVGDLYLDLLERDYPTQYGDLLDCAGAAIQEVAQAAGLPVAARSAVPAPSDGGFDAQCLSQRATNWSLHMAFGLDGTGPLGHFNIGLGSVGGILEAVTTFGAQYLGGKVDISADLNDQYRSDVSLIAYHIKTYATEKPDGTELASGNLPSLLGATPNGSSEHLHTPLARYTDPSPLTPTFDDSLGMSSEQLTSNVLARAFHKSHATDWCEVMSEENLQSLRASAATNGCFVCQEFAQRHIRVGKNADDYDTSQEPLCSFLTRHPAYLYAEVENGDPRSAALKWCCGDDDPDDPDGTGGDDGMNPDSGNGTGATNGNSGSGNSSNLGGTGNHSGGNGGDAGSSAAGGTSGTGMGGTNAGTTGSGGNSGGASGSGGTTGGSGGNSGGTGNNPGDWNYDPFPMPGCHGESCGFFNETPPSPWDPDGMIRPSATNHGDPHQTTWDRFGLDEQAVGEFVLVEDGQGLTAQARQQPLGKSRTISVVTAVAAQLGETRVAIYPSEPTPLFIDGVATEMDRELTLADGAVIQRRFQSYSLIWPSGEELNVRFVSGRADVVFFKPDAAPRGFRGLLGSDDGNPDNDISMRDGTKLTLPLSKSDFYDRFVASYRITQQESLFDYAPGVTTEDFTDTTFPDSVLSTAGLPASKYADGLAACTHYGVTAQGVIEDCILDYAVLGDLGAVRGYQGAPAPLSVLSLADYFNDFGEAAGAAWSSQSIGRTAPSALLANNAFLGPFSGEAVTLTLTNLRPHKTVNLAFDVYVLGPWSGQPWNLALTTGAALLSTSFSNGAASQAFPDFLGVASHPGQTSAAAVNALLGAGDSDAVYHQVFTFAHSGASLAVRFSGTGLNATPGVSFGLDNVEVQLGAPPGATEENIDGSTVIHGAAGDPAIVGCADGRREGLLDLDRHPNIAGCLASWPGTLSLRAPATGQACGDELGACAAPADACAAGWHVCGSNGSFRELLQLSPEQCNSAGGGRFVAGLSHCGSQSTCSVAATPEAGYACYASGYCSEAVCCGSRCGFGSCSDGIWTDQTHIAVGTDQGCGAVSATRAGGILCCR